MGWIGEDQISVPAGLMRRAHGVRIVLAVLATATVAGCGQGVQDVVVAPAGAQMINSQPSGTGTVAATVDVKVTVDPSVFTTGVTVTGLSVVLGEHVTKGQPLVTLNAGAVGLNQQQLAFRLSQAQNQLAKAQGAAGNGGANAAQQQSVKNDIAALDTLIAQDQQAVNAARTRGDQNGIARAQVLLGRDQDKRNSKQTDLASLQGQAATDAAQASGSIEQLTAQVQVDQQLVNIANGASPTVVAPIDGEVVALKAAVGATAAPGSTLVDLIDASNIQVAARFPIAELNDLHPGNAASVVFPGLTATTLKGNVASIVEATDKSGLTFAAIISAPNPQPSQVIQGMQAGVHVDTAHRAGVAVHRLAVMNADIAPQVFVINGGIAHQRSVQLGAEDANWTEIIGGLAVGDLVVVAGNQQLSDGARVHVTQTEG